MWVHTALYVNDFQTLNNPGSWQPVGVAKNWFYLPFMTHKSFILGDVKFAQLSNNSLF